MYKAYVYINSSPSRLWWKYVFVPRLYGPGSLMDKQGCGWTHSDKHNLPFIIMRFYALKRGHCQFLNNLVNMLCWRWRPRNFFGLRVLFHKHVYITEPRDKSMCVFVPRRCWPWRLHGRAGQRASALWLALWSTPEMELPTSSLSWVYQLKNIDILVRLRVVIWVVIRPFIAEIVKVIRVTFEHN